MKNVCFLMLFLFIGVLRAQTTIHLKNPSFDSDNFGGAGMVPKHWVNLGTSEDTPPDIQPCCFEVKLKAQEGRYYIGLVVRENNTWEGLGQKLESPLLKDSVYHFSLWLARSNAYVANSRASGKVVNFISPTVLKIWGVNSKNNKEELLAETTAISHSLWMQYSFELAPTVDDFDEINLIAYYAKGHELKNGNLLIDNCSDIVKK
jgi:hypothetical protein